MARWSEDYIATLQRHRNNISVYKTPVRRGSSSTRVDSYVISSFKLYRAELEGKVGMVIGTEKPWVEAHLLNAGAKLVVTLEYGRIESDHPRLVPVIASELARSYLDEPRHLDFVVSYSSLEVRIVNEHSRALHGPPHLRQPQRYNHTCPRPPHALPDRAAPYRNPPHPNATHRDHGPRRPPYPLVH